MTFAPGNSYGKGRPRTPPELALALAHSKQTVRATILRYLEMTKEGLEVAIRSEYSTTLELMIGSIIVAAIKTGDVQKFGFLIAATGIKLMDEDGNTNDRTKILDLIPREKLIKLVEGDKEEALK